MRKISALLLALLLTVPLLCSCAANAGIITPIDARSKGAAVAFREGGSIVGAAKTANVAAFDYKWDKPIEEAQVWADLYRDGALVSDPVKITATKLSAKEGTIALYTDESDGITQDFTLVLTNGSGSDAKAYLQTGTVELGEAMSPFSTVAIEDTQIAQADNTNVLLVMHDGPDLDSEMNNDLDQGQTEQLIAASTYTLVLNCLFA